MPQTSSRRSGRLGARVMVTLLVTRVVSFWKIKRHVFIDCILDGQYFQDSIEGFCRLQPFGMGGELRGVADGFAGGAVGDRLEDQGDIAAGLGDNDLE